jgi:hypothetical protein
MKRLSCVLAFALGAGGCIAACSSKSSDLAPADASTERPDTGTCAQACCELPQPKTACNVDAGAMCDYAVTCSEGLVVSRSVVCKNGTWESLSDCPPLGGVDSLGCPSAQPTNGAPCALDGGSNGPCGYTKSCGTQICDAGVCVPVSQSAQAQCINGMWKTTPLGPC